MILLSDANPFGAPDGTQILLWLACAWAVMKMVTEGSTLWARLSGREPIGRNGNPVVTRKEERQLTLAEWTALERRVEGLEERFDDLLKQLGTDFAKLTQAGEERASRLMRALTESAGKQHGRIDDILKAVAKLEGTVEQMNR